MCLQVFPPLFLSVEKNITLETVMVTRQRKEERNAQTNIHDDVTPELAMAVLPDYRGQGVGTQLLNQILETARGLFPAVCLSVRAENPVANLYQRAGFTKVEGSDVVNRTGGISYTMVKKFIV
jgi:GNAT superfamily N-acetyltransferase